MNRCLTAGRFVRAVSTGVVLTAWLGLLGCASSGGTMNDAFSRFWGFTADGQQSSLAALDDWSSHFRPKRRGIDWTQDPFLDVEFVPTSQTDTATLASPPPQTQPAAAKPEVEQNPFQVAQASLPVYEVSSEVASQSDPASVEVPPLPAMVEAVPTSEVGQTQLQKLKSVMEQDLEHLQQQRSTTMEAVLFRIQVERMMQDCYRQIEQGQYAEALQHALAAQKHADAHSVLFGPDEEQPGDLVVRLRDKLKLSESVPAPVVPVATAPASVPVVVPQVAPADVVAVVTESTAGQVTANAARMLDGTDGPPPTPLQPEVVSLQTPDAPPVAMPEPTPTPVPAPTPEPVAMATPPVVVQPLSSAPPVSAPSAGQTAVEVAPPQRLRWSDDTAAAENSWLSKWPWMVGVGMGLMVLLGIRKFRAKLGQ